MAFVLAVFFREPDRSFGNLNVTLKFLSKPNGASNVFSLFPLKPLMGLVLPRLRSWVVNDICYGTGN